MKEEHAHANFKKSLRQIIENEDKGNLSAFCQKLNIGYKPMQNYLSGRTETVDVYIIKALQMRFPKLSVDGLFEGKIKTVDVPTDEMISTKLNKLIELAIAQRMDTPASPDEKNE